MLSVPEEEKPRLFRAYIPPRIDFLIRAIVPLKNSGKDWNLSDVLTEALEDWLNKAENRALIERHNLEQALREKMVSEEKSE
ncbi:hypothetical protein H6F88_30080 [Oculatella sp. FACHB-28]|uniref:hypothetical protein n=1 Tax=Cyanophyceae TaxID=3028117 RepID=UPI001686D5E6|nr:MULTISPECIES: hypothetical protein [Cyanophyceae]MBD1997296.1 hypothetical protein [Leptolyngbya sp. FACHB-541]MBD2060196.1 hypothetical protein [Oculatella sp. FACHB-28]